MQLRRLQAVQVILGGLEVRPDFFLVPFRFLGQLDPFLLELAELAAPFLITDLGTGNVILEPSELNLCLVVTLLQVLLSLLQRFVLIEERLAVHRPLQLGVLHLIELLLFLGQVAFHDGQLFLFLFQLPADVLLQGLQMRDEILILLQDVSEGFRLGGFWHQAAFRPCCR